MKFSNMLKALGGVAMVFASLINANAKQLSPDEALQRAITSDNVSFRMPSKAGFSLVHSESFDGKDLVYVFNNTSDGFIVVGGDDRMPGLLGYSDNGNFSMEEASPSLKWWISQYAEEATQALDIVDISGQQSSEETVSTRTSHNAIEPMITTRWDQENPYNLDCPELRSTKCATGCVATAMAQIIKYHGYPSSGENSNTYQWNGQTISYNFASATFDYNKMLDSYSGSATEDQKKAVANLMYACGVSVNMKYSTNESAASDVFIPYALRHFFKYDNGVRLEKREFYTNENWEDLIYSELEAKRPVLYGGQSPYGGGHEFICDGCDSDGFFHMNWGWSGRGDGYFLLNALEPDFQGTGGCKGGYNSSQTAVCGIQPAKANSQIWYSLYSDASIELLGGNKTYVNVKLRIFNGTPEPADFSIFIRAISNTGKLYDGAESDKFHIDGATDGISGIGVTLSLEMPKGLPQGDYKCYIMIKTSSGNIQPLMFPISTAAYLNGKVDANGNITYSIGEPDAKANIRVTEYKPLAQVDPGKKTTFYVYVENIGDIAYSGGIYPKTYKHNTNDLVETGTNGIKINLAPGGYVDGTIGQVYECEPGLYDVVFIDETGDVVSDKFPLSIGDAGVEELMNEIDSADVYSVNGNLVKKNAGKDFISSLPKGIYVLHSNGKIYKVIK